MNIKLVMIGICLIAAGMTGFYLDNREAIQTLTSEASAHDQAEVLNKSVEERVNTKQTKTIESPKKEKRIKIAEDSFEEENEDEEFIRLNDTERSETLNDLYFKASFKQLKDQHKVLFRRLDLSEEDEYKLGKILHEKRALKNLNVWSLLPPGMKSEEARKEESKRLEREMANMRKSLDLEMEELLGEEHSTYEQYAALQKEYWQLSRVESIGAINEHDLIFSDAEQDELAQYMNDSYKDFNTEKRGWERAIRESKESAYEFLDEMRELNKDLIADAPADETQKQALKVLYQGQYEHFQRMVHRIYPPGK